MLTGANDGLSGRLRQVLSAALATLEGHPMSRTPAEEPSPAG